MTSAPLAQSSPVWERLPLPEGAALRSLADGTIIGRFLRMDLASVFQPVTGGASGAAVGLEGFVRAHGRGDMSLTPWGLFSLADQGRALVGLDRLCRIVHTLNFLRVPAFEGRLFMNVHGRLLEAVADNHGQAFRGTLDRLGFPPERVVIEIPHKANDNRRLLALALDNYRRHGFAVAINVAEPSQTVNLLGVVQADYVKFDGRGFGEPRHAVEAAAAALDKKIQPVFTRIETAAQCDFLRMIPGVLLQGRAIAPEQALPDLPLPT